MKVRFPLVIGLLIAGAGLPLAASGQTQYCSSPYYVEQAFPTSKPRFLCLKRS